MVDLQKIYGPSRLRQIYSTSEYSKSLDRKWRHWYYLSCNPNFPVIDLTDGITAEQTVAGMEGFYHYESSSEDEISGIRPVIPDVVFAGTGGGPSDSQRLERVTTWIGRHVVSINFRGRLHTFTTDTAQL